MDDIAATLQRIEAEQRELRVLLEQVLARLSHKKTRCRPSRSRRDTAAEFASLVALVPIVWAALGPDKFAVSDLFDIAKADPSLGKALLATTLDAQRLGALLGQWVNERIDYSVIRRAGTREGVALWRIEPALGLGGSPESPESLCAK